jgi:hypothetical protein
MSAPPQAIAPNLHTSLLNVYIQIANKMGFQKKSMILFLPFLDVWQTCVTRIDNSMVTCQTFQSKMLRKLGNAPWYISNITLHNDLRIPYVTEVIRTYAKNHKNRTTKKKTN